MFVPIKQILCRKWSQWYLFEEKTHTVHGNIRSPGYTTVIQWLSEIWRDFDPNIIINSFDQCGITSLCNLHSVLRAVVEENKTFFNFVDDFDEVDEIYGFTNDDLNLELDDGNNNGHRRKRWNTFESDPASSTNYNTSTVKEFGSGTTWFQAVRQGNYLILRSSAPPIFLLASLGAELPGSWVPLPNLAR